VRAPDRCALHPVTLRRWLTAVLLGSGVAGVAYWRRALTFDGAVAAAVVGAVVFARGRLPAAAGLLAFFGSSSALSKLGEARKHRLPLAQAKGAQRDAWQVLANGGVATLGISLGPRLGGGAYLGALAAAGADTWATELGLLSTRPPRLITTLRQVPPGTSGGVTLAGLLASLGGALTVGVAWWVCGGSRRGVAAALIAGAFGSVADSLLGATLQAAYRCATCGALTEAPTHPGCAGRADLARGQPYVTNDTVNALATLAGAAVGTVFWLR
jgi:uncharacterized protein (TIGR00297 family)